MTAQGRGLNCILLSNWIELDYHISFEIQLNFPWLDKETNPALCQPTTEMTPTNRGIISDICIFAFKVSNHAFPKEYATS